MRRWSICVLLLALGVMGGGAAHAGTYPVYACGTSPTDRNGVNRSWTITHANPAEILVAQQCPASVSAQVTGMYSSAPSDSGSVAGGVRGEWGITAPANTRIVAADLYSSLQTGLDPNWWAYTRTESATLELCSYQSSGGVCRYGDGGSPLTGPASSHFTGLNAAYLGVGIHCPPTTTSCLNGSSLPMAFATVQQATVTLADLAAPSMGAPSGPLTSTTAWHRGTVSLVSGTAADQGGGVRRVHLVVDGQALPGITRSCDHTLLQPCPATVPSSTLALDTTRLADGLHTVAVRVEDAGANTFDTPRWTIRVDNTPPGPATHLSVSAPPGEPMMVTWANSASVAPITHVDWSLTPLDGGADGAAGFTRLGNASLQLPAMTRTGRWQLLMKLVDAAGNSNPGAPAIVVIDTNPAPVPPTDTDGDGTPDTADRCPTVTGPLTGGGCPAPRRHVVAKRTNVVVPTGKARYHSGYRAALVPVRALPWQRTILVRTRKGTKAGPARYVRLKARKKMLIVPATKAQRIPTRVEWRPLGQKRWRALNIRFAR